MAYDHQLPDTLNPTGDMCVPLYIPHDPDYVKLILYALGTLEQTEYYQRDPNFDDENAKIVVAQWRERTITPLISALASTAGCGGIAGMYQEAGNILLTGNKTTLSTTFVDVPEASFSYIFRKQNVAIGWHNVHVDNAGNLTETLIRAIVVGLTPNNEYQGRGLGAVEKVLGAKAIYLAIDTEATYTVKLQFCVIGGNTGTILANSQLAWLIEEWD